MEAPLITIERVLRLEAQAILDCAERLKSPRTAQSFESAIELLLKTLRSGGKIIVTGVGKSGRVGEKIAATLSSTGSCAVFLHPTEGLHGDIGVVRAGDCVLALSFSGNTEEVLRLLPTFRQLQVPLIAMGGKESSQLGEQSDVWLDASVAQEACPHNLAPTSSTTLALAIGDAIAVTLMRLQGFDAKDFAVVHPGGSLAKRLTLKVKDLMARGTLPLASPDTSMKEIVLLSTEHKMGGVMIVDQEKLVGLITDGDIRKALNQGEVFFSLRAHQVMTPKPTTIAPDLLAYDALQLMENRSSQISVLPVVNGNLGVEGFLRIHDLLKEI